MTAVDEMRKAVGRFGISGKTQTQPMAQLSDGLRSRVVFAWLVRAARRALHSLRINKMFTLAVLMLQSASQTVKQACQPAIRE